MRFDATYAPATFMPRRQSGQPASMTASEGERPFRGLFIGMAISGGLWAALLALVF